MNSMNKASGCMFLPGMAPSANGAKISIKPRTNWSDRNRLQSSQRPNGLEKPVAKKVEPYRGWRDQQLKNIPSVDVEKSSVKSVEEHAPKLNESIDETKAATEFKELDAVVETVGTKPNDPAPSSDSKNANKKKKKQHKAKSSKEETIAPFVSPKPCVAPPPLDHSEDDQRIQELQNRLAAIQLEQEVELKVIAQELQQAKLDMRRNANKEEADTLKEHMKCEPALKIMYAIPVDQTTISHTICHLRSTTQAQKLQNWGKSLSSTFERTTPRFERAMRSLKRTCAPSLRKMSTSRHP